MKALPRVLPIAKEEAARAGYTLEELIADDRTKRVTLVRQYAMWRAREETGRSWWEIARVFQRDHTTVIHAYRKIEAMPPEMRSVFPTTKLPKVVPPKQPKKARDRFTFAATFPGNPCRHGHSGRRYVSSGYCVECKSIKGRLRYWTQKAMAAE